VLNRRHRLLTADEFRMVLRRGKKTPVEGGLIAVRPTDTGAPLRCGFVVSKAVGNAVVRNTVKRRLRAACGSLVGSHSGADIVVRANGSALHVSVDKWERVLRDVLSKALSP
jgi:ribonuclease P protein component